MTAQGVDLLVWLETAISERERAATKASAECGGDWYYNDGRVLARRQYDMVATGHQDFLDRPQGEHIALNDPESALRRCAADRKELARHTPTEWPTAAPAVCPSCAQWNHDAAMGDDAATPVQFPCPSILFLAEGYGWTTS